VREISIPALAGELGLLPLDLFLVDDNLGPFFFTGADWLNRFRVPPIGA